MLDLGLATHSGAKEVLARRRMTPTLSATADWGKTSAPESRARRPLWPKCHRPVVAYLGYSVAYWVAGVLGINPSFHYFMREAAPASRCIGGFGISIGVIGIALTGIGSAWHSELLNVLGYTGVYVAIESALSTREANCRHLLQAPRSRRRQ